MQNQSSSTCTILKVPPRIAKLLLPHEYALVEQGQLKDNTHKGSSSIWLYAPSTVLPAPSTDSDAHVRTDNSTHKVEEETHGNTTNSSGCTFRETLLYRPMGDAEILVLVETNQLPPTQPYQAVIEGAAGRTYAEKFLTGRKWVSSRPTTVVEFRVPAALVATLMSMQYKPEDGVVSMGLGNKAGGGLALFNAALAPGGGGSWRIVRVKRPISARGVPVKGGRPRGTAASSKAKRKKHIV